MKFIAGLLLGGLVTLLVATVADYRWEPPSRMTLMAASVELPDSAAESAAEPEVGFEEDPELVTSHQVSVPIRSVTIEPLPAEPAPAPAPAPVAELLPAPRANKFVQAAADPEPPRGKVESAAVDTAVIWKPFHSEVSATGFARRLSTQLGYPFRALREGPARYHVVFDYDTEQQRELLQQQVTALTGFDAI